MEIYFQVLLFPNLSFQARVAHFLSTMVKLAQMDGSLAVLFSSLIGVHNNYSIQKTRSVGVGIVHNICFMQLFFSFCIVDVENGSGKSK